MREAGASPQLKSTVALEGAVSRALERGVQEWLCLEGCVQGHAVQIKCKYLCGDVPTPRRSEGNTPKCSDSSDHPHVCVISHLPILAKTRTLWQRVALPVWWVIL